MATKDNGHPLLITEQIVKAACEGAGWYCGTYGKPVSEAKLARLLGVNRSQPGHWRRGEAKPTPKHLEGLYAFGALIALQFTIDWCAEIAKDRLELAGFLKAVEVFEKRSAEASVVVKKDESRKGYPLLV